MGSKDALHLGPDPASIGIGGEADPNPVGATRLPNVHLGRGDTSDSHQLGSDCIGVHSGLFLPHSSHIRHPS